ncbi:unnamed protein product, partial [Ectocarpus sp. 8 AP-2014]
LVDATERAANAARWLKVDQQGATLGRTAARAHPPHEPQDPVEHASVNERICLENVNLSLHRSLAVASPRCLFQFLTIRPESLCTEAICHVSVLLSTQSPTPTVTIQNKTYTEGVHIVKVAIEANIQQDKRAPTLMQKYRGIPSVVAPKVSAYT